MPFTYRCRKCHLAVSSHLLTKRCPACGYKALRRYTTKEYRQMAKAPSSLNSKNLKIYDRPGFQDVQYLVPEMEEE